RAGLAFQPVIQTARDLVVVSQVYGGGGVQGSTYRNDFVELFNRGTKTVDLTGWTVQYATANGVRWGTTSLSGLLLPGHYYLVQEASESETGKPLPTADAYGTIQMSPTDGKVA